MSTPSLTEAVRRELLAHDDVDEGTHRFGGIEFRLGRRELGHLHGEHLADLPFPRRVRDELVAAGRAVPHHVLPESGWVSRRVQGPQDVDAVVELFRMSYERAAAAHERAGARA
jgi:luciferase-like monooxygenase